MFGGSESERHFVRTEVSGLEQVLSWSTMGLIALVAAYIVIAGRDVDHDLFAAGTDAIADLDTPEGTPIPVVSESAPSQPEAVGTLAGLSPEGWTAYGALESFNAETLYEKINGRAEQYLAYSVETLECASYSGADGSYVDVYLYDMGSGINAFGIYSVERSPDAEPVAIGDDSYTSGTGLFFWQGDFYGQVIGSDTSPEVASVVKDISSRLVERLDASVDPPWGIAFLPTDRRVPGSIQYYMKDALALDFLPETFLARYETRAGELTLFVSKAESESAAVDAMSGYREYGAMFGEEPTDQNGIALCDLGGLYDAVFQHANYVAGVSGATDPDVAIEWSAKLRANLEGAP